MGFFDDLFRGGKRRTALAAALEAARTRGVSAAITPLLVLGHGDASDALCELADYFLREDDIDSARTALLRALACEEHHRGALERLVGLEAERGDLEAAIAACKRLQSATPTMLEPVTTLVDLLLEAERPAEALAAIEQSQYSSEPSVALKRGEVLLALDRDEEALEVLGPVRDHFESLLRGGLLARDEWEHLREQYGEASRLADSAQAELEGRESLVVGPATRGRLDGRSGGNYRLLGESLMVEAEPLTTQLALASPEDTERRAKELLKSDPKSAHGLSLQASALLRLGRVSLAQELFEKASAIDGGHFPAYLGLGAVLDHQRFDLLAAAARLPSVDAPKELARVVPDLVVLTPLEKRVVVASVAPLGGCLPHLIRVGARIQLLPIDVRATDLPEVQDATGERTDDHRAYDAIGGLANSKLAVARIDELLDVVSDHGLVFGHEFAHLVFFHLPEGPRAAPLSTSSAAPASGQAASTGVGGREGERLRRGRWARPQRPGQDYCFVASPMSPPAHPAGPRPPPRPSALRPSLHGASGAGESR